MKPGTGRARLFFAAWPAPEIQQALGKLALELRPRCGGRAIPARHIHLTLVFLGDVERARLPRLESLARAVAAPSFELAVDRVQYWRHNRIVWAGVGHCPPAALALVEQLAAAAAGEGIEVERRPYVPHVTLLREARRAPAEAVVPVIAWPVSRFALVESVPRERGRIYQPLREWPLAA
jgi:RNA 2',3'-cyclic 3'-phosphodiesterase